MSEDDRAILGVGRDADAAEIRAAFRRAAKRTHPDRGGSSEAFRRVRAAADALLADLKAGRPFDLGTRGDDDRTSLKGHWATASAALGARWGMTREPFTVIAPRKIGLSPFTDESGLNPPAFQWLIRRVGPRGKTWDFHSEGSVTRVFFRRGDDASLFQQRFY